MNFSPFTRPFCRALRAGLWLALLWVWALAAPQARAAAPQIVTSSLPRASANAYYSFTLSATDADGDALTWSVVGGALPSGFSLTGTGTIKGYASPAMAGDYSFSAAVNGGSGGTMTRAFILTLDAISEARSLVVTTEQDVSANDGLTSLREALDYVSSLPPAPRIITFDTAVFANAKTIALSGGEFGIGRNVTISGPTSNTVTVSGNSASRIFFIGADGVVTLSHLKLTGGNGVGNTDSGVGGAILNYGTLMLSDCTLDGNRVVGVVGAISNARSLSLTNCTVSNNSGAYVGAIENRSSQFGAVTLSIAGCTFSGNRATFSGGAMILNAGSSATILGSTFAGNTSDYNGGAITNSGTTTLSNCTLSGNSARFGKGGALYNLPDSGLTPATLTLSSCTLAGNSADQGGGLYTNTPAVVNLSNSIVAGNSATYGPDLLGTAAGDYNLVQDRGGATLSGAGNLTDPDPKLGALASNGGPTQTQALLSGSPAIDAANPALTSGTDQRGYARPVNGRSDIGAFEAGALPAQTQGQVIVTTATDEDNGTPDPANGSGTSLREAINFANAQPNTRTTIRFSGLFNSVQTIAIDPALGTLAIGGTGTVVIDAIANTGAKTLTIQGAGDRSNSPIFTVAAGAALELTGLLVQNGFAPQGGAVKSAGSVKIAACSLAGNQATDQGGALYSTGSLSVADSALIYNRARYFGGAIANAGGTLSLSNSTLSANQIYDTLAARANGGAALYLNGGTATIDSCTIASNYAGNAWGGIYLESGGLTLNNSIVTGSGNQDIHKDPGATIAGATRDIIGINAMVTAEFAAGTPNAGGSYVGTYAAPLDPKIAYPADNGGPTQTMALLPDSPAINHG